jgi:hypothetical protein
MIAILIVFFLGVLIVPPIVLTMVGRSHKRRGNPEKAKIFYILSVVYLLVAGGTCYTILT